MNRGHVFDIGTRRETSNRCAIRLCPTLPTFAESRSLSCTTTCAHGIAQGGLPNRGADSHLLAHMQCGARTSALRGWCKIDSNRIRRIDHTFMELNSLVHALRLRPTNQALGWSPQLPRQTTTEARSTETNAVAG